MRFSAALICAEGSLKRAVAFGKPHGKLITNFVCFFRRHFTGLERLPDLIGQHVMLSDLPSCDGGVLTFCK
jgi:hypothetical protein